MLMFEFDPAKSQSNREKHGIDFVAAQNLWLDERLLFVPARDGEPPERRWLAIGQIDGHHWSAIFAERDDRIRIISGRRARREEVNVYDREEP